MAVFVENKAILDSLKPYKYIYDSVVNRITAKKSNVLMFFDYPADEDIMQNIMQTVSPDSIHYMKYSELKFNEEAILKTFSGMIRYTCNNLNGKFNLFRASTALGVTNLLVETLLEMFEDAGMIKIKERNEEDFIIEFFTTVELSKTVKTPKYAEFIEIMNNIHDYKNKFMEMSL